MADIWSGDILLPNGNLIRDVGLSSHNVASSPVLPAVALRFLSTVDSARIPLYLAAGPSLDVWTTSEDTEAWFESILLSKPAACTDASGKVATDEWWHRARSQAPVGILVQVQSEDNEAQRSRVTEILFYGTIAAVVGAAIPTPPSSSPRLHNGLAIEHLPELQVHALPLSSHLLRHQNADTFIPDEARFLPPLQDSRPTPTSPTRKRDIFEEATIANKKARGAGGKGVAAAAARANESQQSYSHPRSLSSETKTSPFTDCRPSSANNTLHRSSSRPLSRSPSISSDIRPSSRKGFLDAPSKRSNLSQVATLSLQSEGQATESRNRDALSKVVMAAMRMHGLQQRKKDKPIRASMIPVVQETQQMSETAVVEDVTKDDEFKLIYHQTFKGAAFALRKHIVEKPLHTQPDRLRDVVEKLLVLYLNDPLSELLPAKESTGSVATPGSKSRLTIPGSTNNHASPFDLPSNVRPGLTRSVTDSQIYTGSPVSRKRNDAS